MEKMIQRESYTKAERTLKDLRSMITVLETALGNIQVRPPKFHHDTEMEHCRSCGKALDLESWQFCPNCGQRFRDKWEELGKK